MNNPTHPVSTIDSSVQRSMTTTVKEDNNNDAVKEGPQDVRTPGLSYLDYLDLNALLSIPEDGKTQFWADKEAAKQYFLQHVNPNTVFFHNLREKLDYLVEEGYYSSYVVNNYSFEFIKSLFKMAYAKKFRFQSFMGAYKFYTSYALKNYSNTRYLERYEDRVCMIALTLADGDEERAIDYMENIISLRVQPATPIMLNAGLDDRGELVSCQLIRMEDSMDSIGENVKSSLQLSKRGGGVGILLTNLRDSGAPIKGIEGQASGLIPVMKLLEDSFKYANQLGARQGAGAVYVSVHHPDLFQVLDSKRENADESIRIKSLSIGLVLTDKVFELAKQGKDFYMFSPYDVEREYGKPMSDISINEHYDEMVENPRIRKTKASSRRLFTTIAELQFESGYPYLMFEDTTNQWNNINGRINMSNLCSEITQVNSPSTFGKNSWYSEVGKDISCNLASLNIKKSMETGDLGKTVDYSIRMLTAVSDQTSIDSVPTIKAGNDAYHSVGLGAMNLHGFLAGEEIVYGTDEALDFVNAFFGTVRYHALNASSDLAIEKGERFFEYELSKYHDPEGKQSPALKLYTDGTWLTTPQTDKIKEVFAKNNQWTPTVEDWKKLSEKIAKNGLYNSYLLAVAPNGSSSYQNFSTSSLHPVVKRIETRKEGKLGRVFVPAPGLTDDNKMFYPDAYEVGPEKIIDTYAVAQKHIDQAMSCTLFFWSTDTTRDLNKAYIYAWSKQLNKNENGELALYDSSTSWKSGFMKTLYYSRVRTLDLSGTEVSADEIFNYEECVACQA